MSAGFSVPAIFRICTVPEVAMSCKKRYRSCIWRVAVVVPCLVAMDLVVVLSVWIVIRTLVANSPSKRNVRNCSASAVADPRAYSSDSPELVARIDCVLE